MRDPGTDFTSINRAAARDGPYGASGDEVDAARAREYASLSVLLRRAPNSEFLSRLSTIGGDFSPLGCVHTALAEAAA
ncbi:MAG: hypothetical protein WAM99_07730, partial [Xanthobacteraceae bacterium]